MKKLYILLGTALLVALVISLTWQAMSFEERLIQIQLDQSSPELAKALEHEPVEVKAIILDYENDKALQLIAQAALLKYPGMAQQVLSTYGDEPEFQEILRTYGDGVIPPVKYFLDNDIDSVRVIDATAQKLDESKRAIKKWWLKTLVSSGAISSSTESRHENTLAETQAVVKSGAALSPEERGWYAVNFIRSEGYGFLGQFITDSEGRPQWIQSERVLEGLNSFFASGIRGLEIKTKTDQPLTAGDVGWAAVDGLVMVSALKVLKLGRATALPGQSVNLAGRTSLLASRFARASKVGLKFARYGKWPAIAVTAYVIVTHPGIINDTLAAAANLVGLPAWLGQFVGWTVILLPLLYLGSWLGRLLVRPAIAFVRSILFLLSCLTRSGERTRSRTGRDVLVSSPGR